MRKRLWWTVLIVGVSACSGGDSGGLVRTTAPAEVRTVDVSPRELLLASNQQAQLAASVTADRGASADVTWTSSNNGIATVSNNGLVTAVSPGTATMTATAGGKSATATVTVVPITLRFDTLPVRAFSDSTLLPAPRVSVSCGAAVNCAPQVRVEIVGAAAGQALAGSAVRRVAAGTVSFADLSVTAPGAVRLRVTLVDGGGDAITSDPIPIDPAPITIDSITTRLVSTDQQRAQGTMVYEGNGSMPTLTVGAVIAGADAGGYLRRVTGVTGSGNRITATTVPAVITDVVRDGSVRSRTRISLRESDAIAPAVVGGTNSVVWGPTSMEAANNEWIHIINGRVEFTKDHAIYGSTNEGLVVKKGGYIEFSPDFDVEMDVKNWQVTSITTRATGDVTMRLPFWLGIQRERSFLNVPDVLVAQANKPFVAFVGGWPVFGRVQLTYKLITSLQASAAVEVTTAAQATGGLTIGAAYNGASWAFDAGPSPQTGFVFDTLVFAAQGSLEANLGLRAELRVWLYESVGPAVWANPFVKAAVTADLSRNSLASSCHSGIELGVGVAARIFGLVLAEFNAERNFLESEWPACKRELELFPTRRLAIAAGNGQVALPGARLPASLVVQVTDKDARPVADVPIDFSVESGGGSLSQQRVLTDASGYAQTSWILGSVPGPQVVESRVFGSTEPPVRFDAMAEAPRPPAITLVSVTPSSALLGVGETSTMIASVSQPAGAPRAQLTWSSTNPAVASVTATEERATVRALGTGTAIIRLTAMAPASTSFSASTITQLVTVTVASASGIAIDATPATLSIAAGGNVATSVNVSRTSYTGNVSLSVPTTLPAGLTRTITQPGTSSSGTVRFSLASNHANFSNLPVRIVASGNGVPSVEQTVILSVTAVGSINITANPASLAVPAGGNSATTVTVSRTNYTGNVTLSVPTVLPAGLSTVVTQPGSGLSGSVRFNLSSSHANFSNLQVRIVASAAGVPSVERIVTVNAQPVGATSRTLSIQMSGPMLLTHTQDLGTSTSCTTLPPYSATATCTRTYSSGSSVTLQVSPASGYRFVGWTGACSGNGSCTVTMNSNVTVGAIVEANVSSSISFTANPTTTSVAPGGSATSAVNLTRSNYSGSVTLSIATTLPAGLTTTITQPGTGSTGSVRFNLATNHQNFTSVDVRVRATGSGVAAAERIVKVAKQSTGAVFRLTSAVVAPSAVTNARCSSEFGASSRVADWSDIQSHHAAAGNPDAVLPLNEVGWVRYFGEFGTGGALSYPFVARYPVHAGFAVFASIGNTYALGRWSGPYRLLCFG